MPEIEGATQTARDPERSRRVHAEGAHLSADLADAKRLTRRVERQVAVLFLSGLPPGESPEFACPVVPAVSSDLSAVGTGSAKAFELASDTPVSVYDIKPYGGIKSAASAS